MKLYLDDKHFVLRIEFCCHEMAKAIHHDFFWGDSIVVRFGDQQCKIQYCPFCGNEIKFEKLKKGEIGEEMKNLKIYLNEKKYPTKIEFCCNYMAGAMSGDEGIVLSRGAIRKTLPGERWPQDVWHCRVVLSGRCHPVLSCCPFCKGDIEFIEEEEVKTDDAK